MATMAYDNARPIDRLIGRYAESHRHPTNVLIHWICVPIIVWTVLALLYALHPHVAFAAVALGLLYYLRLSWVMTLLMALYAGAVLFSMPYVPHPVVTAVVLFVLTWIAQFYGHHVEGKRPSFLEDVQYLMIGPLFLLSKACRKFGIRY